MKEQRLHFYLTPESHRGMRHLLSYIDELNNAGWEVVQIIPSGDVAITEQCFLLCNKQ